MGQPQYSVKQNACRRKRMEITKVVNGAILVLNAEWRKRSM